MLLQKLTLTVLLAASLAGLLVPTAIAAPTPAINADQLFASGQFEPARRDYADAAAAAPADPVPQVGVIRSLLRLDRWDEAITAGQAFTAKFPINADAHGLLALALIRGGWLEPYADEAKKSLTLDPNDYWGLVASGRAADWDGRVKESRALFRQASDLHPELPDAWLGLLGTLDDTKDAIEKTSVTTKYLALDPQGQPYDRENEGIRDFQANADSYKRNFEADPASEKTGQAEKKEASTLKVDFVGDWAIFPVTVNDQRFRLLFDTGAGDLLLTPGAAKRLKLPIIAHSYIRGVNGKEPSSVMKANTMTLGSLDDYHSIPIRTMGMSPGGADGLLGGSTLNNCVITLDYVNGTASLSPDKAAAAPPPLPGDEAVTLPLRIYDDHLFLHVLVNSHPAWAMIDTGAQQTLLSLHFAKDQLKDVPKEEYHTGTLQDLGGVGRTDRRIEYIYSRDQSTITLSQQPPISVEADTFGDTSLDREVSPGYDFEIGLLLGASSLTYARRVTFDYPHHQMIFEYQDPDTLPKMDSPKHKKK